MPNAKEVSDKVLEVWSLSDQVEELRGKYHLKKKDCEAYRESSQSEISENERIISRLRQENWNKRILLAQHENGDEQVIKTVFKNDRKNRLSLQRYTAREAIDEMDQEVCAADKLYNLMSSERERKENKLKELKEELERMCEQDRKVRKSCKDDKAVTQQSVTTLENSLDKALIKYDTARIITDRYHEILDKLKEESLSLPAKLDAMESTLLHQKHELKQLREMAKGAIAARDHTKAMLSKVEKEAYEARKHRESVLTATRRDVEQRQQDADKVERRHARAALLDDKVDQKALQEMKKKTERQHLMCVYEDALRKIKEATNVTSINEVLARVQVQTEKQFTLYQTIQDLEAQKRRLKEEHTKLSTEFHEMKYSGERRNLRGQQMLQDLEEAYDKEMKQSEKINSDLSRASDTMVDMRAGVAALLNRLQEIKLRSPEHSFTTGDIFAQLELSSKKIHHLMKELSRQGATPPDDAVNDNIHAPQFQEFLENRLTSANVRIKLGPNDSRLSTLSQFDFESNESEQHAPTRAEIKLMGQKLINSKLPKKKKSKKK